LSGADGLIGIFKSIGLGESIRNFLKVFLGAWEAEIGKDVCAVALEFSASIDC
jgi:hypothetical protein